MKRTTQILVALVGILLISFAVPVVAQADPVASFTVSATQIVVGESVVATDTSSNPEGKELTYEWSSGNVIAKADSPECLNANCSQVRFTYSSVGSFIITERVKWPGSPGSSVFQEIKVVEASEAPAPIILNGPTTVSLPTVLDVMSPKPNMRSACIQPALRGSEWEVCQLYLIKRVGPDPSGFYHYRFRFVMANPGTVEVIFGAWNVREGAANSQIFTMNVTGNAFRFGDVRSCYWPRLKNDEGKIIGSGWRTTNVYELRYYAAMDSRVVVKLQLREDHRWVTVERQSATWDGIAGFRLSPWTMRYIRAAFGPKYYRSTKPHRALYQIRHGKRVLKQGQLTKKRRCTADLLPFNPLPQAAAEE